MGEWISVKDRLPGIGEYCLVFCWGRDLPLVCRRMKDRFLLGYSGSVRDTVYNATHWQPLPEPPKDFS